MKEILQTCVAVSALFLLTPGNTGYSQASETTPSEFLILVETTENGLKLTCEEGCAWKDLSFSLKPGLSQAVDEYGMTTMNRDNPEDAGDLADFLFTVKRTNTGLSFQGKAGTSWTELSFSCPVSTCHQHIDQDGMAEKD